MPRPSGILASALLISLGIHLWLLVSAGSWWRAPVEELPFPLEAQLVLPPPSPPAITPVTPRPPLPKPVAETPPLPEPALPPAPDPKPDPPREPPPPPVPETVAPPPPPPPPEPVVEEPASPPALRQLPEHLSLRYDVQAGEGGFSLGQALYTWQQRDGRYTLVSIARATGLTSLFVSGQLVQTSEGRIGAAGLQPEQYWLSRNQRRQDTARFDWPQRRLVMGSVGVELHPASQDVLSFPFHLAMTVDETSREWTLWVSNGRKLRDYLFRNLGRETLTMGDGEVETLHLQGTRAGEGTLDVWLAPSRHWLPLRIRTLDQKGKVMVLNLEE